MTFPCFDGARTKEYHRDPFIEVERKYEKKTEVVNSVPGVYCAAPSQSAEGEFTLFFSPPLTSLHCMATERQDWPGSFLSPGLWRKFCILIFT